MCGHVTVRGRSPRAGVARQRWKRPPFPKALSRTAGSGQSSWPLFFPLPAGTFKGIPHSAGQDVCRDHSLLREGTWSQDQQDPTTAPEGPQGVGGEAVPAVRVPGPTPSCAPATLLAKAAQLPPWSKRLWLYITTAHSFGLKPPSLL